MNGLIPRRTGKWISSLFYRSLLGAAAIGVTAPETFAVLPFNPGLRVVAVSDELGPDGDRSFISFSEPSLNDVGQVAFVAYFGTTTFGDQDYGAYRDDRGTLTRLARVGQPLPGGSESFLFELDTTALEMGDPALNDLGQSAIRGRLGGGGNPDPAIVRTDGVAAVEIVRIGDSVPNGGTFGTNYTQKVGLNEVGDVLFEAGLLTGTSAGPNDDSGIFRGNGTTLTQIVREGDPIPDGSDVFTNLDMGSLNNLGQVSFEADLSGGGLNRGLYIGDGSTIRQVLRRGEAAPDGNGKFEFFHAGKLNDSGQMAFTGELADTSGGTNDNQGIFLSDDTTIRQIARKGSMVSDGNGTYLSFSSVDLNSAGQILFSATIDSATLSDRGIFLSDGTDIQMVVRKGQIVPGDGNAFAFFDETALNDRGQAVFYADWVDRRLGPQFGIFFFDETVGLVKVAVKGESLLGSTITGLSFGPSGLGDERSGFNDLGQLAFAFRLADGRSGIAVWSAVPEPASMPLLALGLGLARLRYRRTR